MTHSAGLVRRIQTSLGGRLRLTFLTLSAKQERGYGARSIDAFLYYWPRAACGLLLLAVAAPSRAAEHSGADGFSICSLEAANVSNCEPLSDAAMQKYHLSSEEAGVVVTLKRFAAAPSKTLPAELTNAFAPPQQLAATERYADYWLPARHGASGQLGCLPCGIHFRYGADELDQLTYGVEDRFTVVWNRVLVGPPPK
jgi:hypothetical protein